MSESALAYFINPEGLVIAVPASQGQLVAQARGYIPASPKQISDYQLQEKYGTTPEAVKAFAEHAGSALTLGLSDIAERKLGVSPEAMRAREAANPVASGLGTATGVAAGLFVPGSAPSLIARAGKGVATAVAERIGAGALAKAAALGAGSAVEGAAYGLGQVVHEGALGDPNLTAQSALATIGLSAALGGAIGTSGGLLAKALGDAAEHAPAWLKDFEGERNLKAAGGIQRDISKLVDRKGRANVRAIGVEGRDLGLLSVLSTPESVGEKANALMQQTGRDMRGLLQKADAVPGSAPDISHILGRVRGEITSELADNPLTQNTAEQIRVLMEGAPASMHGPAKLGYAQKFAQGMTLEDLHGMRREISDALYGLRGTQDPFANSYKDALHDLRSLVSDEINQGVERAGIPATEWKALNRRYEVATVFRDLAEKGLNRAHGNNLVSPTEFIGLATHGVPGGLATAAARRYGSSLLGSAARALRNAINPEDVLAVTNKTADGVSVLRQAGAAVDATVSSAPEKVATLSLLERLNQSAQNKIETTISTLVRGGPKAGAIGRSEVAAGIAKVFGDSAEEARASFSKKAEQIRALVNDPEQLQNKLSQQTDDWHEHAPDTALALQVTTARAVAFLASKLPQTGKPGPLAGEPVASRSEVAKFARYYEAVNNPLGVLKQAAAGTLTPEAIEAIQAVYPQLFMQMHKAAVSKLTGARAVPYRSKLMLSTLMGRDMDGTTLPQSILRNRMVFARPSAQPPRPAPSRADKLTLATRMQTPGQASAARTR